MRAAEGFCEYLVQIHNYFLTYLYNNAILLKFIPNYCNESVSLWILLYFCSKS